ncbi:MAG: hypothetical protein A2622_11965 [Bdellovibrionales bacterium RIFCSPHIGHO2_01_FULL_40_29]|nr:MAG: hypothetical protein A2622_11965 [Bdellovibrionales bacterium RIFCSPHIGHO2_01_FULL_40_29]OFZ35619.1 MAG: hypothetical protein A3D17_00575 [Bdellovibrionales bacterium RIFCSPHIGHO2_02_FULL_40_15]
MHLLTSIIVILAISAFSTVAFSAEKKVLLISDIDDTIKASHVLNSKAVVSRFANLTIRFSGMAQLYQLIQNQNPQKTRLVYLSNAPVEVSIFHQSFLSQNNFPPGKVLLRESIFDENHKINAIKKLVIQEKPDVVIMIGDNGERDVEIYHEAQRFFQKSSIQMVSFIHQVYTTKIGFFGDLLGIAERGKKLLNGQIGFVTPVEISLELNRLGLLSQQSADWMIQNVGTYISEESIFDWDTIGNITFPSYKTCDDFVWKWQITKELSPLIDKINSACR